jgi:pyruvate dehydrogenase E1 component alpha subunit
MVLSRKLDQRMLTMQRQGQMGTFAPGIGQEATQIGQVYPLSKEDWFAPSYRSFGAQMWRGWPIDQLLLLWDGFHEGFAPPEGVNDLPFCIVIGSHVPTATGIAMGIRIRKHRGCVMVNFGDGASSQGIVNESLNFAAVYQAPVVFLLENNGWAISMPAAKQVATETYAVRGIGFGIPSMRVDGNDVLAVIVASQKACERARGGGGPTLIEALTYRMSVHTTADDPKVYRNDHEVKEWERRDPIRRFEIYLKNRKVLDDTAIAHIHEECEQEVLAAREKFRERAKAKPREVFDYVYENQTPELEAQKREYLAKLDRRKIE